MRTPYRHRLLIACALASGTVLICLTIWAAPLSSVVVLPVARFAGGLWHQTTAWRHHSRHVFPHVLAFPQGNPAISSSNRNRLFHVVVNRYEEDLEWLKDLEKEIGATVYNKGALFPEEKERELLERGNIELDIHPNVGIECYGYLKYIIDNYDNLPVYSVFVHASIGPGGWVPPGSSAKLYGVHMLNAAHQVLKSECKLYPPGAKADKVGTIADFVSMNDFPLLRCTNLSVECCRLDEPVVVYALMERIFLNFYQLPINSTLPKCVSMDACASFQLSRHIIRSHSREKYWRLWKLVETEALNQRSKEVCVALEHTWHIIFREPPIQRDVNYRAYRDYDENEIKLLSSLVAGWQPQRCGIRPDDDKLNVKRDCKSNTYLDSTL